MAAATSAMASSCGQSCSVSLLMSHSLHAPRSSRRHTTCARTRRRHTRRCGACACVECNVCRVHGTVMCLGLGATMQVLVGSDGRGGDPLKLDRVQVGALIATAAKLATACEMVERFRSLDSGTSAGGKGFGGSEATRDPEPTVYDACDPKARQQAIHKAETFAEYLAKRNANEQM
jgi:hypothetical protein